MSTWLHCDKPEPHEGHSWDSGSIDENDLPWRSSHTCPGVKDSTWMRDMVTRRNLAAEVLEMAEHDLVRISVKHRRTPHQYTVNDDSAPDEEPRDDDE